MSSVRLGFSMISAEMAVKSSKQYVLVTGGAGYIGSHTLVEMLQLDIPVVVIDNFCNSCEESLKRVQKITGKQVPFHKIDLLDKSELETLFKKYTFSAVIHFAGLKAVGESVDQPLMYYHNNITGTLNLLDVMRKFSVHNIVFSSSATVYGQPERLPLTEDCRIGSTNPYGRTKEFIEEILKDVWASDKRWNVILLRYFNPVGAHPSGLIGEDPQGPPNNLMPYVSQVAVGRRPVLSVFGNDYPTKDGTGVRDYIHVVDLALGHVCALRKLESNPGCAVYNLGTGVGYSVMEMITAMEQASQRKISYKFVSRRPGDVAEVYADPSYAAKELNWHAKLNLQDMCNDLWRWQSANPNGFSQVLPSKTKQEIVEELDASINPASKLLVKNI